MELVSIIIPTKNSDKFLERCLNSIKQQSYKNIETIVVDSGSKDNTIRIAKKFKCKILSFTPKVRKGVFDAPHKRNFGVKKAKGTYVYYVDADMELERNVIRESVSLCKKGYKAVIISENSIGQGIWAEAKHLERKCYWGDDTVEAPRFFIKKIWAEVGGLDEEIGGGGDDWDLYQKLLDKGYKVSRIKSFIIHNEGKLSLKKLFKKRFMYGRETAKYISKRPKAGFVSYFPIRPAFIRNWRYFIKNPVVSCAFIIMRTTEYFAGFLGIIFAMIKK